MTSYKTYQQWKPALDKYRQSESRSMLDFCQDNNLNYNSFRIVLRNEKFGLIGPPDTIMDGRGKADLPLIEGRRRQKTCFVKVIISKEAEHESGF